MALWCTMSVVGPGAAGTDVPVTANQPVNTIVTVYNSGAVPVTMLTGTGWILPVTAGGTADNEVFFPGYNQVPAGTVTVPGTFQFDLSFVLFAPQVQGIINGIYTIGTTCYTSDGSVFSASQTVATSLPVGVTVGGQGGQPLGGTPPTMPTFYFGQIGYNLNVGPFLTPWL